MYWVGLILHASRPSSSLSLSPSSSPETELGACEGAADGAALRACEGDALGACEGIMLGIAHAEGGEEVQTTLSPEQHTRLRMQNAPEVSRSTPRIGST